MQKIFVLGAGGFGTSLAIMLCRAGHKVTLWGRNANKMQEMATSRANEKLLKGVTIPEEINITNSLDELNEAAVVIIATPTVGVRETARMISKRIKSDAIVVGVSKGLEPGTLKLLSDVIEEEISGVTEVLLSGPSHAEEIARGAVTVMVAASKNMEAAKKIQHLTANTNVRIYTSEDVVGVQLAGALKNVIAFAAGILDGMEMGDNAKAALMTRGMAEIARLGSAMGANMQTFAGLSGIGDLVVTCCSIHSRNRRCGVYVGEGLTVAEAVQKVGMTVEGITATICADELATKLGVEMPITHQIARAIKEEITPQQAVKELLSRPLKEESEEIWLGKY